MPKKKNYTSARLRPRVNNVGGQQPAVHKTTAAEKEPVPEEVANRGRRANRRHAEPEQPADLPPMEPKNQPTPQKLKKTTRVWTGPEHSPDKKNPQKETAMEWFTQADYDFKSGKALLRGLDFDPHKGYNAVCFLCHEAVEKAVKAAQFATDGNVVQPSHVFIENIPSSDKSLLTLCSDLSKYIGNINNMRYPDNSSIPADRYTRNQAIEALSQTEEIIKHVHKKYL